MTDQPSAPSKGTATRHAFDTATALRRQEVTIERGLTNADAEAAASATGRTSSPTSAVVMGGLAIAHVGYGTRLRFVGPILILLAISDGRRPDRCPATAMMGGTRTM